jgi:hypothetical protein
MSSLNGASRGAKAASSGEILAIGISPFSLIWGRKKENQCRTIRAERVES